MVSVSFVVNLAVKAITTNLRTMARAQDGLFHKYAKSKICCLSVMDQTTLFGISLSCGPSFNSVLGLN